MVPGWSDDAGEYEDVPGFCRRVTVEEVAGHGYILTPGRYGGTEEVEGDGEPFEEKMERLTEELVGQFAELMWLEGEIRGNLRRIGYEFA